MTPRLVQRAATGAARSRSLAVSCAVWVILITPAAHGQTLGDVRPVASDGFGDSRNSYSWSMAWFKGKLFVGTARSAMCVENATIEYYLPTSGFYRGHPAPGVFCPRTIHQADLRAEIWRYDPLSRRWALVYRSSRNLQNPRAPGRYVARDIGYRGMVVLKEPGKPSALYVGALSAGEFIPELARRNPPRILRTTDGRTFRPLRRGPGVIRTQSGPRRPIGFRAMEAVHGKLYVTAGSSLTGDGVVLRVHDPAGTRPRFEQVSPRRLAVFELATLGGRLYAGTGDFEAGYGVWRATGPRAGRWEPVVTGGAGRGATITSVVSMASYRGQLYVGASGWGTSVFPASELIRVSRDGRWDVVVGKQRVDGGGALKSPVSGLSDGFGNVFNNHFWRMQVFRGALLLGTNDWSWSLQGGVGMWDLLKAELGFDLYGTCDGSKWWVATRDAFGQGGQDFGLRTMAVSPAGLFIGTTNHVRGTAVYRTRRAPCDRDASVHKAARPARRAMRLSSSDWRRLGRAAASSTHRQRPVPADGTWNP